MIRHPSNGRRVNINLVDYMLGFTRVEDVRKVIQDQPEKAAVAPVATKGHKTKTKPNAKAEANTKAKEDTPLPMADLPGNDWGGASSSWTKEQDEQIIKFKADNPAVKWSDLAESMNMLGKHGALKERFAELKKEGKIDGATAAAAVVVKKDEKKDTGKDKVVEAPKDEKKDEGGGGKKGKKENKAGDSRGEEAKAGTAVGGKGQFSDGEMTFLRNEYAAYEADKFGWVASRLFDETGRNVHADTVKAALGAK